MNYAQLPIEASFQMYFIFVMNIIFISMKQKCRIIKFTLYIF